MYFCLDAAEGDFSGGPGEPGRGDSGCPGGSLRGRFAIVARTCQILDLEAH